MRFSRGEREALDALARKCDCSRSEAIRIALMFGIPLAQNDTMVNFRRYAQLLEFMVASLGVIILRDHPDYEEEIKDLVVERLEEYHG